MTRVPLSDLTKRPHILRELTLEESVQFTVNAINATINARITNKYIDELITHWEADTKRAGVRLSPSLKSYLLAKRAVAQSSAA